MKIGYEKGQVWEWQMYESNNRGRGRGDHRKQRKRVTPASNRIGDNT